MNGWNMKVEIENVEIKRPLGFVVRTKEGNDTIYFKIKNDRNYYKLTSVGIDKVHYYSEKTLRYLDGKPFYEENPIKITFT